MDNFLQWIPTKLFYGKGQCSKLPELVPKDKKIMLIYGGGSIKRNGVYDEVKKYVTFDYEFGGIEANPTHETCMEAVKVIKERGIEFVLAVGGGSVLDATKYILLACEHTSSNDPYDILYYGAKSPAKIPYGAILTLPATGSETNCGFVITRRATHEKNGTGIGGPFAVFSIVDPTHTFSLPKKQVMNGIADAFCHIYEQYIGHYQKARIPDAFCEALMRVILEVGPKTLENPTDYATRMDFCYAATVALNNSLHVGVDRDQCWAAHMIGHQLTAFYGIDHGDSLTMAMPAVMKYEIENYKNKLIQMAKNVFGIENPKPEDAITETIKFFKSIGFSDKLKDRGFGKEHFEDCAKWFIGKKCGARGDIDYEAAKKIYDILYE